ncbi:MAG: DNA repair protein RadC [SAR324 cluster bacterium]|nr:DNA repair protein RadC [SAR324 cluster bacterium]
MMFRDFYNDLMAWLKQKNYLALINSICQPLLVSTEQNPDYKTLWDRFLRSLIPKQYQLFISLHPRLIETFIGELAALSQYTVQKRITKIIERNFNKILPTTDLAVFNRRISDFHNQLDMWANGSWHQQIQNDRLGTIDKLQRQVGFENDWETAAFLANCGYWYPSSQSSCNAWTKFSGNLFSQSSLVDWWKLLDELTVEPKESFAIDFTLEHIFGIHAIPEIPMFCELPSACFECPLKDNCSDFQKNIKPDVTITLENLIRIDDINVAETTQLIVYLAGSRWTQTPVQELLLNDFPELFQAASTEVIPGSDDEKFVFFLKGLQAIAERLESRKIVTDGVIFNKSDVIFKELKFDLAKQKQEAFYTLILDNKHRKILLKLITRGTLNQSLVHPREVFAPAIQLRAAAVILIHNHPSGDPQPSRQDIDITKRLIEVGNIVGINVLDHVIIGQESYFSFADEELM